MIPNAMRATVLFLFGMTFLFGAGAVCWGVIQFTRKQEAGHWILGGGICMVVGGAIALIAFLAGGNQQKVNRDLSYVLQPPAVFRSVDNSLTQRMS